MGRSTCALGKAKSTRLLGFFNERPSCSYIAILQETRSRKTILYHTLALDASRPASQAAGEKPAWKRDPTRIQKKA
jgi:hypothetical protein